MKIQEKTFADINAGNALVEGLMQKHSIPGVALAVIQNGEITFHTTYGVRNTQGVPMTEGTLFECASLTKSLFGLLAMQEVDLGRIALDAPIAPLLKDEPWSDDPRYATITPRHCLCHGCGLPNWESKPMKMIFDPGTKYSYSGEGYFLLQKLIEQIEGKCMNQLFRERFYGKFGMESSTAYWTPMVGAAFAEGFDKEGKVNKVRNCRRTTGNAPEPNAAWSLYSYAYDYAKFIAAMIREKGGLSEDSFAQMTAVQNKADENVNWGLGFGKVAVDDNILWHWGDNDGFKSFSVWDKATGDGVVVNTNSDFGMDFYTELLKQLTDGTFFDDIYNFIKGAE